MADLTPTEVLDVAPPVRQPWQRLSLPAGASLLAHVALLALVFRQTWILPERLGRMPHETFLEPILVLEWLRSPTAMATLAVWALAAVVGWRRLRWATFEEARPVRALVLLAVGALAWEYSTYEFDAYYGQWHLLDRGLVAALAGLVAWHPAFAVPFLLQVRTVSEQFGDLLGAYSFTDKQITFDAVWLFGVFLLLRLLLRTPVRAYAVLLSSMLAAHFVFSAYTKIELEWFTNERLEFLFTSSHANHWLGGLDLATVATAAGVIASWAPLLKGLTIASEFAPALLFAWRRGYLAIMASVVALHSAVFALSGLLFWKWMAVEIGLMVLIARGSRDVGSWFGRWPLVVSLICIASGPLYFRPARLGWLDTAITHSYDLEAVGRSGRVYPVSRGFMAPFDLVVSQNQFEYLVDEPAAVTTYGATANPAIARDVARLVDRNGDIRTGFAEIEATQGVDRYSAEQSARFDQFMQRYFRTLNARGTKGRLPLPLSSPHHIWGTAPPGAYDMQEPVVEIRMRRRTMAWVPARRQFQNLQDHIVRSVRIE